MLMMAFFACCIARSKGSLAGNLQVKLMQPEMPAGQPALSAVVSGPATRASVLSWDMCSFSRRVEIDPVARLAVYLSPTFRTHFFGSIIHPKKSFVCLLHLHC